MEFEFVSVAPENHRCRVCLERKSEVIQLSEIIDVNGSALTALEILTKCADKQIVYEESKPQHLCQECIEKLKKDADIFRSKYIESDRILTKEIEDNLKIETESFKDINVFDVTNKDIMENGDLDLPKSRKTCKVAIKAKEEIQKKKKIKPVRKANEVKRRSGRRQRCVEGVKDGDEELKRKVAEIELSEEELKQDSKENFKETDVKVEIKKEVIDDDDDMYLKLNKQVDIETNILIKEEMEHISDATTTATIKKEKDVEEPVEPTNVGKLRKKKNEEEKGKQNFTCTICQKNFAYRSGLRRHNNEQHNDGTKPGRKKPFQCRECEKSFPCPSLLQNHMTVVHYPKCPYCDFIPENKVELGRHKVQYHSDEKRKICEICGQRFFDQQALRCHYIVHSDKKKYSCDVCGQGFSYWHAMQLHKRGHTGEKPFLCADCGKAFADKSSYKRHAQNHLDTDGYDCDVCGKKFAHMENLRIHKRLHLVKTFNCQFCEKSFALPKGLKRHMASHNLETKFKCDFCNNFFRSEASLEEHVKIHAYITLKSLLDAQ